MGIHQLKVFASVFKNKSFSRASEELHLTQPTISVHIKALEEEYNCFLYQTPKKLLKMFHNLNSLSGLLGQNSITN